MKIIRITVSNYRNFGKEGFQLSFAKRIQLVIGPNNSGKSNILQFAMRMSEWINPRQQPQIQEIDHFNRDREIPIEAVIECSFEDAAESWLEPVDLIVRWKSNSVSHSSKGLSEMGRSRFEKFNQFFAHFTGKRFTARANAEQIDAAAAEIASGILMREMGAFPKTLFVPHLRRITANGDYSLGGTGIVPLLAAWKSPVMGREGDLRKFKAILNFVRDLLQIPVLEIDIPQGNEQIILDVNSLRLPLSSYGAGVEQLLILAVGLLDKTNYLVCIEEPETNIHPLLQKKLLSFLIDHTKNSYLLATHSTALLSRVSDASVLHLKRSEDGSAHGSTITTERETVRILNDLGVRPGDVLHTNFILWVEGPSDRILINAWLASLEPSLQEGIHYSVLFYGGRVLSHFSAVGIEDDKINEDFIKLLKINQSAAILIDSDRSSGPGKINTTKERIQQECEKTGMLCWITAGREIENYLSKRLLSKLVKEKTGMDVDVTLERFEDINVALGRQTEHKLLYDRAKVENMRVVTSELTPADFEVLDLREKMAALLEKIKAAQ